MKRVYVTVLLNYVDPSAHAAFFACVVIEDNVAVNHTSNNETERYAWDNSDDEGDIRKKVRDAVIANFNVAKADVVFVN